MSFSYAGSLTGGAPLTRRTQIGETCYVGQLLNHSHQASDCTGQVWLALVAATPLDDDMGIVGLVTGVYTINDAGHNTTYHGDTATARTTKAQMTANDPVGQTEIEMTEIVANKTLIRGPLYLATYGTALTELIVTAANSAGTTVTHTGITGIDYADDYGVIYCREGVNKGHYRTNKTPGTAAQVAHIPFPRGIVAGDVFVSAPGVPGITALQIDGDANFIDANDTLTNHFCVWLHTQNLEVSGKEFYVFAFLPSSCGFKGWQAL